MRAVRLGPVPLPLLSSMPPLSLPYIAPHRGHLKRIQQMDLASFYQVRSPVTDHLLVYMYKSVSVPGL